MDLFDKFDGVAELHAEIAAAGEFPFGLCMERVLSATEAIVGGRKVILAGTNNYLGLTFDPECVAAAAAAVREHGTGTTGSRVANGTYAGHLELSRDLAAFLGRRAAIVFTTGYQAVLGALSGLAGPDDVILLDADAHASMYDGCRLSGATVIRFRHNDPADLDRRLKRLDNPHSNKLIVVEGLYSMLGDRVPLAEIAEVKRRHNAYLMVDEAHSLGIYGENRRGVAEAAGVEADVDFVVGTFSKSLGAIGGFCASDHPKFEFLQFGTRAYMFTASLSPSNVASVTAALEKIRTTPALTEQLWKNARHLHDGLDRLGFDLCADVGPVVAVKMPDRETAVEMWNRLLQAGVYVNLAIPPGTPGGLALLRCSLSAGHGETQIAQIIDAFARADADMRSGPQRAAGTGD